MQRSLEVIELLEIFNFDGDKSQFIKLQKYLTQD
jgi:hypothetical protein